MYQAYAADPQMRLNVGIRRRLAPLVENSRRRIELLNMLLFSMPGTPIVYYGDEIGMGDNIYLGDRNGVRTPMQWSGDRNGGFSRADPARLFAPPIIDPVYGYQAINVEAQERSPVLAPELDEAADRAAPAAPRVRPRLARVRRRCRTARCSPTSGATRTRPILVRRQPVAQPAAGRARPVGLRRAWCRSRCWASRSFPRISADRPSFFTLGPYAAHWFSLVTQPMQLSQTHGATAGPGAARRDRRRIAVAAGRRELGERCFDSATAAGPRAPGARAVPASGSAGSRRRRATVRDARFTDWVDAARRARPRRS